MKRILGILLASSLLSALPCFAGIAAYGSYWDTEAMGETGGITIRWRTDEQGFAWELRGGYFPDLTEDIDSLLDGGDPGIFDLEIEAIPIDLGVVYQLGSGGAFSPYAGGGVSYFLLDSNAGSVSDEVGFYGLAGVEIGSGSLAFVVEVVYRVIEGTLSSDPEDWKDLIDLEIDERIDLDLGGYGLNIGVVFRF